jgi:hypothetical protein
VELTCPLEVGTAYDVVIVLETEFPLNSGFEVFAASSALFVDCGFSVRRRKSPWLLGVCGDEVCIR